MNLFLLLAEDAARLFAPRDDVGAWIHELHHAAKKDAPSGTALLLKRAMVEAGYRREIDVAATRAGSIPGTHTIGFDGPSETVTLTHQVRDRGVFARGALEAARWLVGRRGWFTMRDVLTATTGLETDMRTPFTGVGTALITPFTAAGAVDEPAVRRLARRQIDLGTHFLVPCGTTGEVPTLSAEERRRVVEIVVDEAGGKTPVLAGAGGYDTREVAHAAAEMHAAGRRRPAFGDAVLQPADAGRAVSSTTARSPRRRRCRSSSTTCRAAPAATSRRRRWRGWRRFPR